MRLFIAIELPPEVQRHLARVQDRLQQEVRSASWTKQANLHLTLKFLGEVPEPDVPQLTSALTAIHPIEPFNLLACGITCFPSHGPIRIVAASFNGDEVRLRSLYHAVEETTAALGFARERRDYHAHATLARPRSLLPSAAKDKLTAVSSPHFPGPSFTACEFVLMESRLLRQGAQYTPLARFPLVKTNT